jgi:hypothetical protein
MTDAELVRTGAHIGGVSQRFVHDGRIVEAARFVANGPEIARWVRGKATGFGTTGRLSVKIAETGRLARVEMGDWVVRDGDAVSIVPQVLFAGRYRMVG